jgi:hypothetical protein
LIAGWNQNVMRLVLIKLITAGGIELEASPLRATVDYPERNSPLQHDAWFHPSFFATSWNRVLPTFE